MWFFKFFSINVNFKCFACFLLLTFSAFSQNQVTGYIRSASDTSPVANVEIYNAAYLRLATSDAQGFFQFTTDQKSLSLLLFCHDYKILKETFAIGVSQRLNIQLKPLAEELSEVQINSRKAKVFEMKRLNDVEGTSIYAGKKTEVVLVEQSMANLASNNARQIYNQVAGLNIYQNDDAGLQLNIGGRGLDPNRTSNFNTRQNGYDISADVLGYPESYYAPASEGVQEIQIIRGAASLQYGTQFGGLINFKMKKPNPNKTLEIITRNTLGSNGLYTNFTSFGGTLNTFSYYVFSNYKTGDGFRPNSQFDSENIFSYLAYEFSDKTKVSAEITYLKYLSQQPGGHTDNMFNENIFQSNRERNWFGVNWLLYNMKFSHAFSKETNFTFSAFGLKASREALGFRVRRVATPDPLEERDLIRGTFSNFGFESKLLSTYTLFDNKAVFLIGAKYYNAKNTGEQGPGSSGSDANFEFQYDSFPNYRNQSRFNYPNLNFAAFGEHIFYFSSKFSVTPGFRYESIKTGANGFYRFININEGTGEIKDDRTNISEESRYRNFFLLGGGVSYKPFTGLEVYGNVSQNYRSVTFSDITIVSPSFRIDPNITDEKGLTTDIGIRGKYKNYVSYDIGGFFLNYNNRIGFVLEEQTDTSIKTKRTNVGDAIVYGLESMIDLNLNELFIQDNRFLLTTFVNLSLINSEYTTSIQNGIQGNKVEFVPDVNIKTGVKLGFKNLLTSIQYTYLSSQFTDATNAVESDVGGVIGEIPAYGILDVSASYTYKRYKLETGVNNVLDSYYFTRRASGYPGPGIIPSPNRNFYLTLQVKI